MTYSVGIFVFNNIEVLDFAGPYEVFTCASRVNLKASVDAAPLFKVFTIGASIEPVKARAGLLVHPDYDFLQAPKTDILIIPGGVVTEELKNNIVIAWIKRASKNSHLTASVCTGAFLLAQAGLLNDKQVTTHWEDIPDLQTRFPDLDVVNHKRWVDNDDIITSGGISAGIDMSLHIVERLSNRSLAKATARQMEFDWSEN